MTELHALDGSTQDRVGSGGAGLTLQEIAVIVRGTVAGARCDLRFLSVAPLDRAGRRDLGLLSNRRYLSGVADTDAGALLVAQKLTEEIQPGIPRVEVSDPSQALASLLPVLHPLESEPPEVHESVSLDAGVQLGAGVSIGPFSVIGKSAQIGNGTRIGSHVFVGAGCEVGEGCTIHPHVTLYSGTRLGDRVIVHAGANLGVDGFGYATDAEGHRKVQQVGRCLIEKDVEIGAGTCIDRGSIGDTVIGAGTKIDNLVHIAHNVRIGPRSMIIAQVGIAGSTRIGAGAVLGGQAGFVGHINIGDGARIGGQAGVISDVAPGTEVIGFPARPQREFLRGMANAMKLGALKKRVSQLEYDITARSEATPADADELE